MFIEIQTESKTQAQSAGHLVWLTEFPPVGETLLEYETIVDEHSS
jgi:hypothetical protein